MDLTFLDITRVPKCSVASLVSLPNLIEDPDVEGIFGEEMVRETGLTTKEAATSTTASRQGTPEVR